MKAIGEKDFPLSEETFLLIGIAMDVHRELGCGFSEVVYKDALENELIAHNISFEREKEFKVSYKGKTLSHTFRADFVIQGQIILEAKVMRDVIDDHYQQVLNYLKASKCKIGLLLNFGQRSLIFKRVIL